MISLDYAFYHIERVIRIMRGDQFSYGQSDSSVFYFAIEIVYSSFFKHVQ